VNARLAVGSSRTPRLDAARRSRASAGLDEAASRLDRAVMDNPRLEVAARRAAAEQAAERGFHEQAARLNATANELERHARDLGLPMNGAGDA
jgi:hypothetical protein